MRLLKNINHKEKGCYKNKKSKKEAKNSTEEIIHDELFIIEGWNNKYDSKKFIAYSGATLHMATTIDGNYRVITLFSLWEW